MLTRLLTRCSRWAAALALPVAGLASLAAHAQGGLMQAPELSRPKTLVLLSERIVPGGKQATGVYAIETDPAFPDVKRVKVWLELPNDLQVRNETIRCSAKAPMRVTSDGRDLIVRQLNPGGAITPANRIDHLIWWAVCFPDLAQQDPAGLRNKALELGFSTHLQESEQRVPQPSR
ncbi:MAG: hypothetical protein ACO23C_06165 [Prochlorococcaceae cyanobacterium]|jgi:hypothetical protein